MYRIIYTVCIIFIITAYLRHPYEENHIKTGIKLVSFRKIAIHGLSDFSTHVCERHKWLCFFSNVEVVISLMRVGVHVSRFVLGGLTNFQLSLNAVLATVPVFGLRGVVLCHHFHKLA